MTGRVIYHHADHVKIRMPYDAAAVQYIKDTVPYEYREWDPILKLWTVDDPYAPDICEYLTHRWPGAFTHDYGSKEKTAGQEQKRQTFHREAQRPISERRVLFVTDDAPDCVVDAAYKALSRLYHPDLGGDVVKMQALNAAMDRIRFRRVA